VEYFADCYVEAMDENRPPDKFKMFATDNKEGSLLSKKSAPFIILGGLLVLLILGLLLFSGGDDDQTTPAGPTSNNPAGSAPEFPEISAEDFSAEIVDIDQLREEVEDLDYPVYWAGERENTSYELTIVEGNVFIRYLTEGAEAGNERPDYLSVGTYPAADGVASLETLAAADNSLEMGKGEDDSTLLFDSNNSNSIYVAYEGGNYQIEVYSPDPEEAFNVAQQELEPVVE
jgi:hypothetical protein